MSSVMASSSLITTRHGDLRIETVFHDTKRSTVFRAKHIHQETWYILKIVKMDTGSESAKARMRQENKKFEALEPGLAVANLGMVEVEEGMAIIYEDHSDRNVQNLPGEHAPAADSPSLTACLQIAMVLAEKLDAVHKLDIVHKNLKPANVHIESMDGERPELRLKDFGYSVRLNMDVGNLKEPEIVRGCLPYLSPELTGRINYQVDYRSDFYSLGVLLYELLSGRPPFVSEDPLEIIHSHIARQPKPLSEQDAAIPEPVSDIVSTLLEKSPENRYQSAHGLSHDLDQALRLVRSGSREKLKLKEQDVSGRITVPHKVIGREKELSRLVNLFREVQEGTPGIALIGGEAGIGKTFLTGEFKKQVITESGYYIYGKFDKFRMNVPYSALVEAFQGLICQILTEGAESIRRKKEQILDVLGSNAGIIVNAVPDLEQIIGPQPEVPDLGIDESQSRFTTLFARFAGIFSSREKPLVCNLDDLQWADQASLNLVETLIQSDELKHICFVLAYRNTEENRHSVFNVWLDNRLPEEALVSRINLRAFTEKQIEAFIKVALNVHQDISRLGAPVFKKTLGNPFYTIQFLKSLAEGGILRFSFEEGWSWDAKQLEALEVTGNVIDLMSGKLHSLPESDLEVLKTCACLGNQFSQDEIPESRIESYEQLFAALEAATREGLLIGEGEVYHFVHDRVRESAYSQISISQRSRIHFEIGRHLLKRAGDDIHEHIFQIVNQLNQGSGQATSEEAREELARLNYQAGLRAKNATAYEAALEYLSKARDFFPQRLWNTSHDFVFSLEREYGLMLYIAGEHKKAEEIFDTILVTVVDREEELLVYRDKMLIYTASHKPREALELGRNALRMLGVKMPKRVGKLTLLRMIVRARWDIMRMGSLENLQHLPRLEDPKKLEILRLLVSSGEPAFIADPDYFPVLALKAFEYTVKYGNSQYAPYTFLGIGVIMGSGLGDYKRGYDLGRVGIEIMGLFDSRQFVTKNYVLFGSMISHWNRPLRESLDYLLKAYSSHAESGDLPWVCHAVAHYVFIRGFSGAPLDEVLDDYSRYWPLMKRSHIQVSIQVYELWYQLLQNLARPGTENPVLISGQICDETTLLEEWIEGNEYTNLVNYMVAKQMLCFLFGQYREGLAYADRWRPYLDSSLGLFFIAEHYFYDALLALSLLRSENLKKNSKLLARIKNDRRHFERWLKNCPENFRHKFLLIQAELASLLGRKMKNAQGQRYGAETLYEQARSAALDNGFTQDAAIASELAARHFQEAGMTFLARSLFGEAYRLYSAWGAGAKAVLVPHRAQEIVAETAESGPLFPDTGYMDLSAIIKASQTISREIQLDRLLEHIMQICIENAGAERGFLILEHEDGLCIEAAGSVRETKWIRDSVPLENTRHLCTAIVNYVHQTGDFIVLDNAAERGMFVHDPYVRERDARSVICFPISYKQHKPGIIYLENNLAEGVFTRERSNLIEIIAAQAAISIENAQLVEEKEQSARHQKEVEIAAGIQRSLLPQDAQLSGFQICGYIKPAENVAGDYYDVINGEEQDWIVIGDVSGHGIGSGLAAMMVQTAIQYALHVNPSHTPSSLLDTLNASMLGILGKLSESKHRVIYMTINILAYDRMGHFLHSGQHQDILVYREAIGQVERIQTDGKWIGIQDKFYPPEMRNTDALFTVRSGDVVLLYTDGVIESKKKDAVRQETEAHDDEGRLYTEGLADLLQQHGRKSAEQIQSAIIEEISGYDNTDDITFMVLKKE